MENPYCIRKIGVNENGKSIYGMVYNAKHKHLQHIGFPDSWGVRKYATTYMANRFGLTYSDYVRAHREGKI